MTTVKGVLGDPDCQIWKMIERKLGKTAAEPEFEDMKRLQCENKSLPESAQEKKSSPEKD